MVGYDLGDDDRRLRLATDADVPLEQGDITDGESLAPFSIGTRSPT